MNIDNFLLKKTNNYFQKISSIMHRKTFGNNSYEYIANEPTLIYDSLNIIKNCDNKFNTYRFLDVGSGVGHVCAIANLLGLNAEGIEYNSVLYDISKKMYPEINICYMNIRDFDNYNEYDIIYYYAPFFNDELLIQLKEKIENSIDVGKYIITGGLEKKDSRFKCLNQNELKNRIWVKIK